MVLPLSGVLVLLFSASALAVPVLNNFSSGTTISSGDVNANFSTLHTAVQTLEDKDVNLYIFPAADGNPGDVLVTDGSWGLSWTTPVGGGGITQINGDSTPTQTLNVGNTGTAPTWSTTVGAHTLDIPMASATSVTAGLISKTDYDFFNGKLGPTSGFAQGGNNFTTLAALGTNDNFSLTLKTNGLERMRIDTSGRVGLGTAAPAVPVHVYNGIDGETMRVENVSNTSPSTAALAVIANLSATTSGEQYGMKVQTNINQGGTMSYTALKLSVTETTVGSGNHNLLDMQVGANSRFTVNKDGYISTGNAFMGKLTANASPACTMGAPTLGQHTNITSLTLDFGSYAGFSVASPGVYEVLMDVPYTSGGDGMPSILLSDGTNEIKLQPGRNIKRLGIGTWSLRLGCSTATSGTVTFQGATSVFGMRKLN